MVRTVCFRETQCVLFKMKNLHFLTQIFSRQINYLAISLVKLSLSRNFCQKSVRDNFRYYQTVTATLCVLSI